MSNLLESIVAKCTEAELDALEEVLNVKTAQDNTPWYKNDEFLAKLANEHSLEEIDSLIKSAAEEERMQAIEADYHTAGTIQADAFWDRINQRSNGWFQKQAEARAVDTVEGRVQVLGNLLFGSNG